MGKINYELWSWKEEVEEFRLSRNSLLCLLNISIYGKRFVSLVFCCLLTCTIPTSAKDFNVAWTLRTWQQRISSIKIPPLNHYSPAERSHNEANIFREFMKSPSPCWSRRFAFFPPHEINILIRETK